MQNEFLLITINTHKIQNKSVQLKPSIHTLDFLNKKYAKKIYMNTNLYRHLFCLNLE